MAEELSWLDKATAAAGQVGQVWGTFQEVKNKYDGGLNPEPVNTDTKPQPAAYPAPSSVFEFGEGAYGGFSGVQLALAGVLVIGLVVLVKVTKK